VEAEGQGQGLHGRRTHRRDRGRDVQDDHVHSNGKLKIKVDDQGILKSASLKSLAGGLLNSAIDGETFHGSMTISAKTVDVDDLPFEIF